MRKAELERRLSETEAKRAEEERRLGDAGRRLAQLEQALNGLSEAVVVREPDGTAVFTSSSAEELLRPDSPGVLLRKAVEQVSAALREGGETTEVVELHGPPRRSLVVSALRMEDDRKELGTLCIVEDVSERRQLDAVRRDFVANLGHELRTPVGALAVLAETMADEEDAAALRRLALRVGAEAGRAQRLVDELLDLSRIEFGGVQEPAAVDITAVVRAATERVEAVAARQGVDVRVAEPSAPIAVPGDERQLVTAVTNLLDNAVKYSEPGTVVDIGVTIVSPWVEIEVRDRGAGIPARDVDRVFERFYRVDRGRSRDTGGTGLGLAIVRHVAVNHGGDVSVQSREGEGSTFQLRLPLSEQ